MSLQPTQTLKCHLCGEYYIEKEGHDRQKCLAKLNEELFNAIQNVQRLRQLYLQALAQVESK